MSIPRSKWNTSIDVGRHKDSFVNASLGSVYINRGSVEVAKKEPHQPYKASITVRSVGKPKQVDVISNLTTRKNGQFVE